MNAILNTLASSRELKTAFDSLPKINPELWHASCPNRYLAPPGYQNPKIFSVQIFSGLAMIKEPDMNQLTHVSSILSSFMLAKYRVPTYFLAPAFADAVARTRLPEGLKLSDLRWPLPAMLFVLPSAFSQDYFGWPIEFISVCRVPKGTYPDCLELDPATKANVFEGLYNYKPDPFESICSTVDRFISQAILTAPGIVPYGYTGNYPLTHDVNIGDNTPYVDTVDYEHEVYNRWHPRKLTTDTSPTSPEEDRIISSKMNELAIKIMLALAVRPGLVKSSTLARPGKVKRSRTVDALWHPSIIGSEFKLSSPGNSLNGTHICTRTYFRWGHFTHIALGPRADFISINELPRNEEGKVNWTVVPESTRAQFWNCHELRWIEPTLVNLTET